MLVLSIFNLGLPWGGGFGQVFSQGFDDSSSPHPQANDDACSTVQQDPDGGLGFLSGTSLRTNNPQGNQWSDGITAKGKEIPQVNLQPSCLSHERMMITETCCELFQ